MKTLRIYADTSVFGGCFDEEFNEASLRFFAGVRDGSFRLVVSDTTLLELTAAPERVRYVLSSLPPECVEVISITDDVETLRDAYIRAKVVGRASLRDAEHIAAATVAGVDIIVSWNFKHIVHYEKISGYNGVNLIRGHPVMRIYSPLEVVRW